MQVPRPKHDMETKTDGGVYKKYKLQAYDEPKQADVGDHSTDDSGSSHNSVASSESAESVVDDTSDGCLLGFKQFEEKEITYSQVVFGRGMF